MTHGDDETQVEVESLWETGLGVGLNDENTERADNFPVIIHRGEEHYLGRRGIPGGGGTSMMKPPKRADNCT